MLGYHADLLLLRKAPMKGTRRLSPPCTAGAVTTLTQPEVQADSNRAALDGARAIECSHSPPVTLSLNIVV